MTNPNTSNAFLACRGPLTDTPPNSYSDHHPLCSARRGALMEKCGEHWKSVITSSDGWGIWNPERSASCLNTHGWSGVTQRPERASWVSYLSAVKRMSQRKAEGNKLFIMKLNGSSGIGIRKCMLEPFSVTWSSVALSTSVPLMVHAIIQVRILEWVAIPSSRGSSCPRDQICIFLHLLHWQACSLPLVPPGKPK